MNQSPPIPPATAGPQTGRESGADPGAPADLVVTRAAGRGPALPGADEVAGSMRARPPMAAAPARLLTAATVRPIRLGDRGPLIATLRSMLVRAGLLAPAGTAAGDTAGGAGGGDHAEAEFDEAVRTAVQAFQQERGLVADGVVGSQTALLLDEARWRFGQRTMLLTPDHLMRGDDVAALQERMVVLGMHTGPADGIFGRGTDRAVRELQRGLGLNPDGMFGPRTLEALARLSRAVEGGDAWALRSGADVAMAGRRLLGKTIALDAANGSDGHGVSGHGLLEADITHDIVRRLADRLRQVGASVTLTHPPGSTATTAVRAQVATQAEADLVISFHCEVHASPLASGLATFYWGGGRIGQHSASGERLATLIQREVVARTGVVNCRSHPCAYDLVRLTPMPAVMVGLGYLSNPQDADRLADPHARDLIAEAVVVAVQRLYLDDHEARTGALKLNDIIARSQAPEE